MDDFFKSIKDNLENRPERPFREESWLNLQRRMHTAGPGRRRPVLVPWWMILPLLLLLGVAGWFFMQWQIAEQQPQSGKERIVVVRDTVYESRIIFQSDTVYRTPVVVSGGFHPALTRPLLHNALFDPSSLGKAWSFAGIPAEAAQPLLPLSAYRKPPATEKEQMASASSPGALPPTPFLPGSWSALTMGNPPDGQIVFDPGARIKRRTLKKLAASLHPRLFTLGAGAGGLYPLGPAISERRGYTLGLRGQVYFGRRLSLWAEADYGTLNYQTSKTGAASGLPSVEPPGEHYIFQEASVVQSAGRYTLGVQYQLPAPLKWRPFLGIGLSSLFQYVTEAEYEFKEATSDFEVILERGIDYAPASYRQFLTRVGVQPALGRQWHWQLEAVWHQNLSGQSSPFADALGLRTGIIYRLGQLAPQ